MWTGHSSSSAAHQSTHLMAHMCTCIKNEPVTSALCRRSAKKRVGEATWPDESGQDASPSADKASSACQGHFISHLDLSPRLSRASRDGCSTQKDVYLFSNP